MVTKDELYSVDWFPANKGLIEKIKEHIKTNDKKLKNVRYLKHNYIF